MSNFQSTVKANLTRLVECTTCNLELCNLLKERKLVAKSEYEELAQYQRSGSNSNAASYLYNYVIVKISTADENKFIQVLRDSGNEQAVDTILLCLTAQPRGGQRTEENTLKRYLPDQQFKTPEENFITDVRSGNYPPEGKFEGLHYSDEENANTLLRDILSSGCDLSDHSDENSMEERGLKGDFLARVKKVVKCIKEGTLWWNKQAFRLPPHFVNRRVKKLTLLGEEGEGDQLSELTKFIEPFLWLSDFPGTGKSTAMTKLEEELRRSLPSSRIVVRLRFKDIGDLLQAQDSSSYRNYYLVDNENTDLGFDQTLHTFLSRFVSFLPLQSLSRLPCGPLKVIFLLERLDEACPPITHVEKMFDIIHLLLASAKKSRVQHLLSLCLRRDKLTLLLHKIFLTTRPNMRQMVEYEFGVDGFSLLPLNVDDRIRFLSQEVSEVINFPIKMAEKALQWLPFSAQSVMGNPRMLFLFAQVIKSDNVGGESPAIDLFDLYERLIFANHWLHLSQENITDLDMGQREQRLKNMLEENISFYYTVSLNQIWRTYLFPGTGWEAFGEWPVGPKRKELLSYGLLAYNSIYRNYEFLHPSFADFFYVRLLQEPTTSALVRNELFRRIYTDMDMQTVEEFLSYTLRTKWASGNKILPVTMGWLSKEDLLSNVLLKFIRGSLFPILGENVLSSTVDLENQKVIECIIYSCEYNYVFGKINSPQLMRWLTRRDPEWIRSTIFKFPPLNVDQAWEWDDDKGRLAIALLCADPEGLARSLSEEEIATAIVSCEKFISCVCLQSNSNRDTRLMVENRIGRQVIRKAVMTEFVLSETFSMYRSEVAWWLTELLTKEEVLSILTDEETRISDAVGDDPETVVDVWGDDFVGDLLKFRFKFGEFKGKSVFEGEGRVGAVNMLWNRIVEEHEGVVLLREALINKRDWTLLEQLEKRSQIFNAEVGVNNHMNIVERIITNEEGSVWDKLDSVPFEFLPYVVRYGKLNHVKRLFNEIPDLEFDAEFETVATALVISILVDNTDETYKHIFSLMNSKTIKHSYGLDKVRSEFLWMKVDDLRKGVTACLTKQEDHLPLVCQVSWGEVLLRLLKVNTSTIKENIIDPSVANFLKNSTCCGIKEVLVPVLRRYPSHREFLQSEVAIEISRRRMAGHTYSNKRLLALFQFLLPLDRTRIRLTWWNLPGSFEYLLDFIIEVRFCMFHDLPITKEKPEVATLYSLLQERLKTVLESKEFTLLRIFQLFQGYRTEEEWDIILQALQIIPERNISVDDVGESRKRNRYHGYPETFFRVWLRHFGAEETRKMAQENGMWPFCFGSVEAAILAVELGSLQQMQETAWPSLLSWRDRDGSSLLDVSMKLWGEEHEVSRFLQEKFWLPFNQTLTDCEI